MDFHIHGEIIGKNGIANTYNLLIAPGFYWRKLLLVSPESFYTCKCTLKIKMHGIEQYKIKIYIEV